jgi:Icc-related predicted phosphoesterase
MIRLAAIADVHCTRTSCGRFAPAWRELNEQADVFVIGGDLTTLGTPDEVETLAEELQAVRIPKVAVLGNHDYHSDKQDEVSRILSEAGVHILEGTAVRFEVNGESIGIAGTKGFGGGFAGACASEFGEPEMRQFTRLTTELAGRLQAALRSLQTDYRVVLLHYSPIETTLQGEEVPIYPFLGSYLLAEACDAEGADLIVHGHAHKGSEKGVTAKGIQVRNVAMPLVRHAYVLFHLEHAERMLPFQ